MRHNQDNYYCAIDMGARLLRTTPQLPSSVEFSTWGTIKAERSANHH
jgi:hypothetical protein